MEQKNQGGSNDHANVAVSLTIWHTKKTQVSLHCLKVIGEMKAPDFLELLYLLSSRYNALKNSTIPCQSIQQLLWALCCRSLFTGNCRIKTISITVQNYHGTELQPMHKVTTVAASHMIKIGHFAATHPYDPYVSCNHEDTSTPLLQCLP